jgi:hypothetical protein
MIRKWQFVMLESGPAGKMRFVNRLHPKAPGSRRSADRRTRPASGKCRMESRHACRPGFARPSPERPRVINSCDSKCFADHTGRITSSPRLGKRRPYSHDSIVDSRALRRAESGRIDHPSGSHPLRSPAPARGLHFSLVPRSAPAFFFGGRGFRKARAGSSFTEGRRKP